MVTKVPEKIMLRRSATGVASGSTTSSLATGDDSPVRADSFTRSSADLVHQPKLVRSGPTQPDAVVVDCHREFLRHEM